MDQTLEAQGILPDFAGPWSYTHRRTSDTDVYFVAGTGQADCTFRVSGKEPELWDPVTGQTRDAACYRATDDGRTVIPLRLPENGSVFVVFRRPAESHRLASIQAPENALEIADRDQDAVCLRVWQTGRYIVTGSNGRPTTFEAGVPEPQILAGPWQVSFAPGWGAPESSVFERLVAWNEHPDQGIKYFSGTATYRKTFDLNESQAQGLVRLQLGQVKHIAQVRVNGQSLGVVWTDPWSVDLTGIAKPGENKLEIDVTNLWVNRLIGDAGLPEEKRLTKTHARRLPTDQGRLAHLRGYLATDPLVTSGLLGPVRLEFGTLVRQDLP
jgi:hypothetical protein